MTISKLKPRATRLNENENQVRLRPDANGPGAASGYEAAVQITPSATTQEDGTTSRVRKNGMIPNGLMAVSSTILDAKPPQGQAMGNLTYVLGGGSTPSVPVTYAHLFEDGNNSILGNGADGITTINYTDDADTARVDTFQLSIDGLGPHFTTFKVKSVQSVVGTGFDTSGLGAPTATDRILFGPTVEDTVHGIVGTSGRRTSGPWADLNAASTTDGDSAYILYNNISDGTVLCSLPDLPGEALSVQSITVTHYTKVLGAASAGVDLILKTLGAIRIIANNSANTGDSSPMVLTTTTLSVNPATGNPWTVGEINALEIGVTFKGDNPAIEKRFAFCKIIVNFRSGFQHPTIDGEDVLNIAQSFESVNQDPFGTPVDTRYVPVWGPEEAELTFEMGALPAEADSVISVKAVARWMQENLGEENGTGQGDYHCGIYFARRGGLNRMNRLDGPLEQANSGGAIIRIADFPSNKDSTDRFFANRGDPVGGCGAFKDGIGIVGPGFGTFFERSFTTTLNSSSVEITIANVDGMRIGVDFSGASEQLEHRMSRVYGEVEFRRKPVGAPFPHLAIDDDPNGVPATIDAQRIVSQHTNDKDFVFDFAGVPDASEIISVKVRVRARTETGATKGWRVFFRTSGGDTLEAEQTNVVFAIKEFTRTTNPDTGQAWTRDEINTLQIGWRAVGENAFFPKELSALELEVEFVEIPEKIDAARDTGSRRLRLYRKPLQLFKARLPLQFLDPGLMGSVVVSHRAIPTVGGVPGQKRWQRRFMRVLREVLDLNALRVELTLVDLRDFLLTFWMTMKTRSRGLSFDGMAIMSAGTTVRFNRKTNAYHPDPNSGLINELTADEPKVNQDGILVENASRNDIINSSFSEGSGNVFDGWTQFGAGLGGASIVAGTGVPRLWAPDFFDRHLFLTGATTPGDVGVEQTVDDVSTGDTLSPAGSRYVFTIDHIDPSGQPLSVLIERQDVTNQSYNPFTDSFQAGTLWIPLPVRSTITRDRVGCFARMTESITSELVDVKYRIAARTSANQVNRVYHVQWEGGTIVSGEQKCYPTSRILTRNGPVVRDQDGLFAENTVGRLTWPVLRGTFFGIFKPLWQNVDLPDSTGRKLYIIGNVFDTENHDVVYFDLDLELLVFERKLAGIVTQSTLSMNAISMGQEIRVGARWTSSEKELDLPANTLTVFGGKDLEEGTSAASLGPIQPPSDNDMFLGSRDGSDLEMGDGTFSEFYITQQVLTRDEIRRLP